MSKHYEAHLESATEFFIEGNFEAARAASLRALESNLPKGDNRAHCLLGRTLIRLDDIGEAKRVINEALAIAEDPQLMGELAHLYTSEGIFDENCAQLIDRAIHLAPDNADAYIARYLLLMAQNEPLKALEDLKRGLRRGAQYDSSMVFDCVQNLAQSLCDEERFEEAFSLSNEIADYFNSIEFYLLNARLAELASKPRDAVCYFKKSLPFLRQGKLRSEVLESIAKLAI